MKKKFGRVLALLLAVGMIGTSPAVQVFAEETIESNLLPEENAEPEQVSDEETPRPDVTEDSLQTDGEHTDASHTETPEEEGLSKAEILKEEAEPVTEEENPKKEEENELVIAPEPDVNAFPVHGDLFDDVNADAWFFPYVTYTLNKGIMTGKGNNLFAPSETLVRAQFAVVLWRISGSPEAAWQGTYPDVPEGQFYTSAVEWASGEDVGVIGGYDEGNFGPNDNITREQMATMLYRYAKYKNLDITHTDDLETFPDAGSVTEFASEAMQWAVGSGIIKGDKGNLNPQGNTNRAECATMLQRFCETFMPGELQNIDLSAGSGAVFMTVDEGSGDAWLKVTDAWAARGVAGVQAKVWCYDDQSDAGIYNLVLQPDGSYGSSASVKYHGYHTGTYKMQAYILLDVGVRIPVGEVQTAEIEGTPGYYQVMNQVQGIYDAVGYDLYACYLWCVNNLSYRSLPIPLAPADGYTAPEWYAMQGFMYGSGNCYVYAAVFYYCALGLGYDAEYIEGRVPLLSGGYGPHGWVIINQNGGSYICDPEFQDESGYNCWMQPINSPIINYVW